jgi:hypothetical protein
LDQRVRKSLDEPVTTRPQRDVPNQIPQARGGQNRRRRLCVDDRGVLRSLANFRERKLASPHAILHQAMVLGQDPVAVPPVEASGAERLLMRTASVRTMHKESMLQSNHESYLCYHKLREAVSSQTLQTGSQHSVRWTDCSSMRASCVHFAER